MKNTLKNYIEAANQLKSEMNNYIRTDLKRMFEELKVLYPEIKELQATAHFNEGTLPFIRIFCKTDYHGKNIEVEYREVNMNIRVLAELNEECIEVISHNRKLAKQ